MSKDLQILFHIQKVLTESGYYDTQRIAKEIFDFSDENDVSISSILERISQKEPWEYIKGETEFHGNVFLLNKHTLIPRIETEQLVDIALDLAIKEDYENIIDVGTGSGCIIISIAKGLVKKTNLIATDIRSQAIQMAQRNSRLNNVSEDIRFEVTNLISGIKYTGKTLIIANLPYIPTKEYLNLDDSVLKFEPKTALDGGTDGIQYYKDLKEQILSLKKDTTLLIEIDPLIVPAIKRLFNEDVQIIEDFRNLPRFALLHLP